MNRLLPAVIGALVLYAAPAWSQVQRWELVPELRIGSMDDPGSTLTWVTGVAVRPNGQVYVAQPQDRTIRIFDSEGEPAGSIGRAGEGPGEFSEQLGPIGFLGDTLWVSDGRLQRVSFFDLAGTFLTSLRMASPALDGKFLPTAPVRMLADGTGLVRPGYGAHLVAQGQITRAPLLRIDRGGTIVDTVLWLPVGADQVSLQKGDLMHFTGQPFADAPLSGLSPAGDVVVVERKAAGDQTAAHFGVIRISPGGDTIFSKRYRYEPIPLPNAYVDSVVGAKAEMIAKGPMFRSALEAERELRKVLYLPPMRVPVTGVVVARDGSIWLKREDRSDDVQVWNVLTAQGAVAATLRTPKRTTIRAIDGSTVWAVERDELDVPYLVRYAVRRVQR